MSSLHVGSALYSAVKEEGKSFVEEWVDVQFVCILILDFWRFWLNAWVEEEGCLETGGGFDYVVPGLAYSLC